MKITISDREFFVLEMINNRNNFDEDRYQRYITELKAKKCISCLMVVTRNENKRYILTELGKKLYDFISSTTTIKNTFFYKNKKVVVERVFTFYI
ncbi:hypothetical protein CSB11_02500 [Candidatus Campbellbacteria bacterium]|nr:MAG: hypothetical protein CSB11_02500 [Candidatus Campbellbacteria bacterium]